MNSNPWSKARTISDLGQSMADWLEGRIPTWPGYLDTKPDAETKHLIPVLVACNRAGYVTTCSQPGEPSTRGHDGRMWRQRAAVDGWIKNSRLLRKIRTTAKHAEISVIINQPGRRSHSGMICTEADEEPVTKFGWSPGHRRLIASEWPGVGRHAIRDLRTSTQLTLVDPQWGRDSLLWEVLAAAVRANLPY